MSYIPPTPPATASSLDTPPMVYTRVEHHPRSHTKETTATQTQTCSKPLQLLTAAVNDDATGIDSIDTHNDNCNNILAVICAFTIACVEGAGAGRV